MPGRESGSKAGRCRVAGPAFRPGDNRRDAMRRALAAFFGAVGNLFSPPPWGVARTAPARAGNKGSESGKLLPIMRLVRTLRRSPPSSPTAENLAPAA